MLFFSNMYFRGFSSQTKTSNWTLRLTFENGLTDNQNRLWVASKSGAGTIATNPKYGTYSLYNNSENSGCIRYTDNAFAAGSNDFTYDFWFNSASSTQGTTNGECELFDYRGGVGGNGFSMFIVGNGFRLWNDLGYLTPLISDFFTVGTYVRVTVTRKSGTTRIFKNGVLQYTFTFNAFCDAKQFNIGSRYDYYAAGGSWLSAVGYFDDFKFKNGTCYYEADFNPAVELY